MAISTAPIPKPTAPTSKPEILMSNEKVSQLKKYIIGGIIAVVVILAGLITWILVQRNQAAQRASQDQQIIQNLFNLRNDAADYYQKNHSYKDWSPSEQTLNQIKSLGSEVILRKPDYQNYLLAVYLPTDKKYLCFDTNGFVGEIDQLSDNQTKCQ